MQTVPINDPAVNTPQAWADSWNSISHHYIYRTRVHDLGHGQIEVLISRSDRWAETPSFKTVKSDDDKALANAERSARRAKSEIRRKIKSMGCDTMLTLTYHENMQCEETVKKHLKEFIRRMNRVIKGFAYVAAYERQKRGAWHVHLAIHRVQSHFLSNGFMVKSFNLVRSVWRSVVGALGGNIDIQRRRRSSKKTVAQLAAYISKYISKSFDEPGDVRTWKKRYTSSRHDMPEALVLSTVGRDLVSLIHDAIAKYALDGSSVMRACVVDHGKGFFFTVEPAIKNPLVAGVVC